jgi:hypothetical protein
MEWVEAGIQLAAFVVDLLVYLAPTHDGLSPGLTRTDRRSGARPDGATNDDAALDGSAVLEFMNRWAERQDVELRDSMVARSRTGWRSSEQQASWSPNWANPPTSDPMWDRELDG